MILLCLRQALITSKLQNTLLDSKAERIHHMTASTKTQKRLLCTECNTQHSFHTGHNLLNYNTFFHSTQICILRVHWPTATLQVKCLTVLRIEVLTGLELINRSTEVK